jgi:2-polyprenyl-3-methyl-5-hydroxy-6-metoxy-1,4-benzoquinol methylase
MTATVRDAVQYECSDASAESSTYDGHRFALTVRLARAHGARHGDRWLDIGCHNGTLARQLVDQGFSVVGTDVYPPEVKLDTSWDYVQQRDEIIPLADSSAQVVSALEVIEHVVDTDRFLEELQRVMAPSALLILSTPNINMLRNRWRVLFGGYPYGLEWKTVIHHVRLYNVQKICEHLAEHRFDVLAVRGVHLLPTRLCRWHATRWISDRLAEMFPTLCSNMIVVASSRR